MDRAGLAMMLVAAYDIAEDARRAKVAAMLQMHGDRVQKSVFVLSIAADDLAELRTRVAAVVDLDQDSFYVFHQCATCWEMMGCDGQASRPEESYFWIVV